MKFKTTLLMITVILIAIALIFVIYFLFFVTPSNSKNWESGQEKQPLVDINNSLITVNNFRQWRYKDGKPISFNYSTKEFNVDQIDKVYFLIEPFGKFGGVAHTYFLFTFTNGDNTAISVEARREKGEKFDAFKGLFKKFELIILWGDNEDITLRRVMVEKNKVYKYPLKLSQSQAKKLLLQLAEDTNSLETNPQFYNTFYNNCTNVLAKVANKAYPNSVPLHISWFLPGYSVEFLQKLGYLDINSNFNKEDYLIRE